MISGWLAGIFGAIALVYLVALPLISRAGGKDRHLARHAWFRIGTIFLIVSFFLLFQQLRGL